MIAPRQHQRGLSLIELLISMSIGAFMLIGIISLVAAVSATRTRLATSSEQIENARYSMFLFNEDVAVAGFFGEYHPGVGIGDYQLTDPCDDSGLAANLGFDSGTIKLPVPVSGVAAGDPLPDCIAAESPVANAEVLTVRRVGVTPVAVADIAASNTTPYLQIALCALDTSPYLLHSDPAQLTLRNKACDGAAVAWPYQVTSYFLSTCEDCSNGGDGRPTLKFARYANGTLSVEALVSGVEDMHFQYGLDLTGDGSPDCYVDNPALAAAPAGCAVAGWSATPVENWQNVVAIKVHLLVRAETETLEAVADDTYDIGRAARVGPFDDRFKRQVSSSVIMLPNVAGPRE